MFLRDAVRIHVLFFSSILVTLSSCTPILWPFFYDIHCTYFSFIYDDVCYYSPISPCVVSYLSLYTCFFMYAIHHFPLMSTTNSHLRIWLLLLSAHILLWYLEWWCQRLILYLIGHLCNALNVNYIRYTWQLSLRKLIGESVRF